MLNSIIKDNIEEFKITYEEYIFNKSVYFGEYSLLSILYIFNAKKILKKYELVLIENHSKEKFCFEEDTRIDEKFSCIAKKCYRRYIYAKNISPIEVLVMQKKYSKAVKLSKMQKLNASQQDRLKIIINEAKIARIEIAEILSLTRFGEFEDYLKFHNWKFLTVLSIFLICVVVFILTVCSI